MSLAEKLARRRQELLAISELQRRTLFLHRQTLQNEVGMVKQRLQWIKQIRDNPLIFGVLALALAWIKPQRIKSAVQQSQSFWQRMQAILPLLMPLLRRDKVK
ncbi:MAG: hypothetical protein RL748_4599 [Pseudomonadota bacterium]|jgi:hypothetical protein